MLARKPLATFRISRTRTAKSLVQLSSLRYRTSISTTRSFLLSVVARNSLRTWEGNNIITRIQRAMPTLCTRVTPPVNSPRITMFKMAGPTHIMMVQVIMVRLPTSRLARGRFPPSPWEIPEYRPRRIRSALGSTVKTRGTLRIQSSLNILWINMRRVNTPSTRPETADRAEAALRTMSRSTRRQNRLIRIVTVPKGGCRATSAEAGTTADTRVGMQCNSWLGQDFFVVVAFLIVHSVHLASFAVSCLLDF